MAWFDLKSALKPKWLRMPRAASWRAKLAVLWATKKARWMSSICLGWLQCSIIGSSPWVERFARCVVLISWIFTLFGSSGSIGA